MVTVVKLKIWLGASRNGTVTVQGEDAVQLPSTRVPAGIWLGGLKGPSAPVLPLSTVWPCTLKQSDKTRPVSISVIRLIIIGLLMWFSIANLFIDLRPPTPGL